MGVAGFATPERNVPYLLQGGLGLPDRDYYLDDSARMQDLRQKYLAHVGAVLALASVANSVATAARVLALETKIAEAHVSRQDSSRVLQANNPWRRNDFASRAPGLDWATFFRAAGLEREPMLMVWQPSAVSQLSALVASEPLSDWQAWLTFHAIDRRSRLLPKAFVDEDFAFYGQAMRGTPKLEERWKRGVSSTNGALPDAVGKLYVARHFPPESKARLEQMVHWWTKADREHFEASGQRLVAQYDAYKPFHDLHVNGKLTLGENIADVAGLAASHDAWLGSLGAEPAPVVHGMTGEQQFFIAYGQTWRGKQREPALREQLITDGHGSGERLQPPYTLFIAPANMRGERAALLFNPRASFPLAQQLRTVEGAPLGDVYARLRAA